MIPNPPQQTEALFPAECHFKIIAKDLNDVQERLDGVLAGFGCVDRVRPGNRSASGKYTTYNVSLMVESIEWMRSIDAAFRDVAGVRMVL